MNPGPIEEAGKVAVTAIDALKGAPVLLALIVLQALILAGVGWSIHERAVFQNEERKAFADLLGACIGPKDRQ
jgi:hypothetical protein